MLCRAFLTRKRLHNACIYLKNFIAKLLTDLFLLLMTLLLSNFMSCLHLHSYLYLAWLVKTQARLVNRCWEGMELFPISYLFLFTLWQNIFQISCFIRKWLYQNFPLLEFITVPNLGQNPHLQVLIEILVINWKQIFFHRI